MKQFIRDAVLTLLLLAVAGGIMLYGWMRKGISAREAPGRLEQALARRLRSVAIPAGATKGGSGKKFLIIALIGGAAAGGLAAALGGKGSSSPTSSPVTNTPGTVLVPGAPTIQPPH